MKKAGYTAREMKHAGYAAASLAGKKKTYPFYFWETRFEVWYSVAELHDAGYDDDDVLFAGYPAEQLKEAGYTAREMKHAGYAAASLAGKKKTYPFYFWETRFEVWYPVSELHDAGYDD